MEIKSLSHFIEETRKFADSIEHREAHQHVRCLHRQQANALWELVPKLYRGSVKGKKPSAAEKDEILDRERLVARDFRLLSSSLRKGDESDAELYFLQQHYGMPTRLLDWTTNPLIALYFACAGQPDHHGQVFFLDAYRLPKNRQPDGTAFGVATDRRDEFCAWMEHIMRWRNLMISG